MTMTYSARRRRLSATALGLAAALWFGGSTAALANVQEFKSWLADLRNEAMRKGISEKTVMATLTEIEPIPRIIELDRKQPEFTLTFQQYIDRVVPASRIAKGREKYRQNEAILNQVAEKYGVQARFVVALWGIETDFGRVTGGFPVVDALATLAYDGRRSSYFRGELFNALKILDEGHIAPKEMMGSWAGAMGQSQFMPSSFVRFAVDENGDGRRDIWTTVPDVLGSAANYLSKSGWRDDQTWGREVRLPADFDKAKATLDVQQPISAWQAMGVRKADGNDLPGRDLMASIIIPDKSGEGPAYMVYENYRTILKWNRSHYFATAVGLLSDAIAEP